MNNSKIVTEATIANLMSKSPRRRLKSLCYKYAAAVIEAEEKEICPARERRGALLSEIKALTNVNEWEMFDHRLWYYCNDGEAYYEIIRELMWALGRNFA